MTGSRCGVLVAMVLAFASCNDDDGTKADLLVCPSAVVFGACDQGTVCTEWGYPEARFPEIARPGPADCATRGGTWTNAPCRTDDKAGGCLTSGSETCAITWLSAEVDQAQQGAALCKGLVRGRWIDPGEAPH